jgi:general L-amino acid transport system permease protein
VALALLLMAPALSLLLMAGGWLGLAAVPTTLWGGLALTVVVASTTLAGALPLGLALALGRRSALPVIRGLSIAMIEFWRGIPLLVVLFLVMTTLPLLLPPGLDIPPLVRALAAFILFNAAGMAEVFRGGLQAIPKQQVENALSLGLTPFQVLILIELPQAFTIATPGLINTAIAIVKETTVILIIGLMDFLAQIQAGLADPQWIIGDQVRDAAYLFAALVFWAVCFALSRVSARLERTGAQQASR